MENLPMLRVHLSILLAGVGLLATFPARCATPASAYVATLKEGDVELRTYPVRIVAQVEVSGERDEATEGGFALLAGYFRGANLPAHGSASEFPPGPPAAPGQTMPLPRPMLRTETSFGWRLQMAAPEGATLQDLPVPGSPRVSLAQLPTQAFVATRISGAADFRSIAPRRRDEEAFAARHGMTVSGPPAIAIYTRPGTVWVLQRMEILLPVETR